MAIKDLPIHETETAATDANGQHPGGKTRSAREFERARRHARRVRLLKIGLPIIGLIIVLGGVAVTWLARSLPDNLSVAATTLEDGRIVMSDPRMSGVDGRGRPYTVTAARALQPLDGGAVDLETLNAEVSISDDATADITARNGRYMRDDGTLELDGGITVETTNGIMVDLRSATIDIERNALKTEEPLKIRTPGQKIDANALSVSDGGRLLSFRNGVSMTLTPRSTTAADERRADTRP